MIKVTTIKTKYGTETLHDVQTEYSGTIDDLSYEFEALLNDGYNDPEIRGAFSAAFTRFNERNKHVN